MNEFQKTTPSTASTTSSVNKMPFYVADAVLILASICILAFAQHPLSGSVCWALAIILGCGAWIAILPWFQENKNNAALSQLDGLRSVSECIQQMNTFSAGMNSAIASLANVQKMTEASARAASDAENKIVAHSQDFAERISKAVSYEKSSFQIEIDAWVKYKRITISFFLTFILYYTLKYKSNPVLRVKKPFLEKLSFPG